MNFPETLFVEVTQEHLDQNIPPDHDIRKNGHARCEVCPVALATKDAINTFSKRLLEGRRVRASQAGIGIYTIGLDRAVAFYRIPENVAALITIADLYWIDAHAPRSIAMLPISFHIAKVLEEKPPEVEAPEVPQVPPVKVDRTPLKSKSSQAGLIGDWGGWNRKKKMGNA